MPDLTLWGLFIVASVVLLLTPGPAVLFIVARSLEQGRAAGLSSRCVTISAPSSTSPQPPSGSRLFSCRRHSPSPSSSISGPPISSGSASAPSWPGTPIPKRPQCRPSLCAGLPRWLRGQSLQSEDGDLLPRLPPAIRRSRAGAVHWQILILGLTFMGLGIMSDGMFALIAGAAGDFLRRSRRFLRFQRWFAGTSFIGLGVTAALATRK